MTLLGALAVSRGRVPAARRAVDGSGAQLLYRQTTSIETLH